MAVDANILIFERTKEEMRAGKTIHSAIDAGFTRAFPSIRDSNLSTLITCLILWMFGTGPIKALRSSLDWASRLLLHSRHRLPGLSFT